MATSETIGAFIGGLRVVVIDGTTFDVPDSNMNARVFGRPGSRPGTQAAFPKVRLVMLIEAGRHLIFGLRLYGQFRFILLPLVPKSPPSLVLSGQFGDVVQPVTAARSQQNASF